MAGYNVKGCALRGGCQPYTSAGNVLSLLSTARVCAVWRPSVRGRASVLTPPCPWWLPPCFAPRCARLGLVLPRGTGLGRALLAPQPLRTYRRWRDFLTSPQCVVDKDTFSGPLEDSFRGGPCAPRLRIRVGVFRLGLPSRGASILSQSCFTSKERSLSTQSRMAGEVGLVCGYPRMGAVGV